MLLDFWERKLNYKINCKGVFTKEASWDVGSFKYLGNQQQAKQMAKPITVIQNQACTTCTATNSTSSPLYPFNDLLFIHLMIQLQQQGLDI
jgi:hypothetical protein